MSVAMLLDLISLIVHAFCVFRTLASYPKDSSTESKAIDERLLDCKNGFIDWGTLSNLLSYNLIHEHDKRILYFLRYELYSFLFVSRNLPSSLVIGRC